MGYRKILNLYKPEVAKLILSLDECYAMEKIHGSSAHFSMNSRGEFTVFAGGVKHSTFLEMVEERFGIEHIKNLMSNCLATSNSQEITVFGEVYGGKCQKMSQVYGPLNFIAFEVCIDGVWLDVPVARDWAILCGFEFVHYEKGPATLEWLGAQRDKPSVQANLNGMGVQQSEGIVIRPLKESTDRFGERILAKHKSEKMRETRTPRAVDPDKIIRWEGARKVADEFVVPMRLNHVLDKLKAAGCPMDLSSTKEVIMAMAADIRVEEGDTIEWTAEVNKAVGAKTAQMYKRWLENAIE